MEDIHFSFFMHAFVMSAVALYGARLVLRGRARSQRADQDGGSVLLSKGALELGYWLLSPLVNLLARLGITPNGVTLFSLLPGLGAGVALACGWLGLGCFLATVAAFCDTLDGILARKLGVGSDAGETLDAVADRYTEFLFLGGLVLHFRADAVLATASLTALLGAFMVSYTTAKAEAMGVKPPRGAMRRAERIVYLTVAAGLTPYSLLLIDAGQPRAVREFPIVVAIVLVGLVANASVIRRTKAIMNALNDRPAASVPAPSSPSAPSSRTLTTGTHSPQPTAPQPTDSRGAA